MSDTDEPTIEGKPLSDLRVADLKKELELRSLAKSGNKSELMARLKEHILSTSLELSKNADQSVGDTDQCNTKKESCADNTLKLPELHGNGDTSDDAAKQIVEKQNKPDDADADADADSHLVKADKAVTKQQEDTAASTPIRSQSRESFISAVDSSVIYAATPMQPSNTATPISTPQKSDNEPAQTVQEPASAVKKTEESQVNQEVVNVSVTNGSTLGIEMDIGTEFDEPRAKLANSFTIEKPKDKDAVDEKSPIAPVQSSPAPVAPVTGATYATRNLRINRAPSSTTAVEENGEEQLATRTSRWGNSRAAVARERDSVAISAGSLNTILPTSATASSGTTVIKPTVVPQASSVIDEDPQVDTPTPIVPAPPVPVPVPVPVADDVKIDRQEAAVVQDTPKKMEHRKPVSEYVEVSGLVRPFSLPSLWTLLERSAHVDAEGASALVKEDFWIDAIKSRCVVHYASVEYAQKARETLEALRWPPFNPAVLRAEFSSKELLDACRTGTGTVQTQRRVAPREREPPPHEKEPPKESQPQPQEESQSQDDTKKTVDAEEKPQQPINVLDSLFKKTAALPAIYWLPLTEEDALKRDEERLRKRLQQRTAKAEPAPAPALALAPAPVPEPASRHRESPPTVRASAANERESARQRDGDRQPQPVRASAANEHESARQRDRDRQPQPGRPDARERWPNNREREERPRERFPAAPARFDAMRRTLAPFPLSGAPGHFDRDRERAQNNQFAAQAQTQAQANRWKEDSRQRNGNRRSEDKYKSKAKDTVANKRRRASSSSSSSSSSSDSSSSSSSSSSSDSRSSSSSSSSSSTSSSSPDRKRQRTRRSESTSSSDSDARGKRDRRPQAAARRGPAPVSSSRRH